MEVSDVNTAALPVRMRAADVAELTGMNIQTIQRAYHKGYLKGRPPRGMARPVFFKPEDVVDWLDGGDR